MEEKKKMPLVSIVVPVYNVEKYLHECLDSLVAQTYSKKEIILVDDGSTDSSGEICENYCNKYSFITVIHKQNEGLGIARNTGLEQAVGEYVYFLDSDDYIVPDEIEYLVNKLIENKVDACFTGFISVKDNKDIIRVREYQDEVFEGNEARDVLFPKMLGSLPEGGDSIEMSASAQIYSMKPILEHNVRFVSEREYVSEDLVFNMEYLMHANGACTIRRLGNYYRNNLSSLSRQYRTNRINQITAFHTYMLNELKTFGYGEEAMVRHTKQFFVGIRSCILQEHRNDKECLCERINNIKGICSNKIIQDAISIYPVNRLGFKQRFFLFLLKHKMALILYCVL